MGPQDQSGNFSSCAGPIYLAQHPYKSELYIDGKIGGHGIQAECVQATCGVSYRW